MTDKLKLDRALIAQCREDANTIALEVQSMIDRHTTVSVERSALRLMGVDGVDDFEVPLPNLMVEEVRKDGDLSLGISAYLAGALEASGLSLPEFCEAYLAGQAGLLGHPLPDRERTARVLAPYLSASFERIARNRRYREEQLARSNHREPQVYVIVATGNIYEDVRQARSAVSAGADIIAVIRSTGQSLLDYVPYGATTEGFGGTMATQENFRIMRQALDEAGAACGRYIQLVNYASGLCMPEIAAIGALERLDMMLNDSMYGIIFRDINMQRTFVDQYFSRSLNALAGIIINTGEDNYLTTADAVEAAHTVTVSQLLNEYFAKEAGLQDWQLGLGHAFEIDPSIPDSFRLELAHALLARQLFPEAPLKWMPPTKHMTGDVFRGHLLDGFFNLAGAMTGQGILLVGMMTEAVVTPWLSDRDLALQNVRYVLNAAGGLTEDFHPPRDGFIQTRARQVLDEAVALLDEIATGSGGADTAYPQPLLAAIADGTFGAMKRPPTKGKGLDGVARKADDYDNPAIDLLETVDPPRSAAGRRREEGATR